MDDCFMKPDRMRHGYLVMNGQHVVNSSATEDGASEDAAQRNERAAELGIAANYFICPRHNYNFEVKDRQDVS